MVNLSNFVELLYTALHSPHGIVVAVSDTRAAQQKLYKARQEAMDPALQAIKVHLSPFLPEEELWITNGKERTGTSDGSRSEPVSGGLREVGPPVSGRGLSKQDHSGISSENNQED